MTFVHPYKCISIFEAVCVYLCLVCGYIHNALIQKMLVRSAFRSGHPTGLASGANGTMRCHSSEIPPCQPMLKLWHTVTYCHTVPAFLKSPLPTCSFRKQSPGSLCDLHMLFNESRVVSVSRFCLQWGMQPLAVPKLADQFLMASFWRIQGLLCG